MLIRCWGTRQQPFPFEFSTQLLPQPSVMKMNWRALRATRIFLMRGNTCCHCQGNDIFVVWGLWTDTPWQERGMWPLDGKENGILEVFLNTDLEIKQKKKKNTVPDNNGDPKNKEKQLKNYNCKLRRNNRRHKPSFPWTLSNFSLLLFNALTRSFLPWAEGLKLPPKPFPTKTWDAGTRQGHDALTLSKALVFMVWSFEAEMNSVTF